MYPPLDLAVCKCSKMTVDKLIPLPFPKTVSSLCSSLSRVSLSSILHFLVCGPARTNDPPRGGSRFGKVQNLLLHTFIGQNDENQCTLTRFTLFCPCRAGLSEFANCAHRFHEQTGPFCSSAITIVQHFPLPCKVP